MCRFENRHLKVVSGSRMITFPPILTEDFLALTAYSLNTLAKL